MLFFDLVETFKVMARLREFETLVQLGYTYTPHNTIL